MRTSIVVQPNANTSRYPHRGFHKRRFHKVSQYYSSPFPTPVSCPSSCPSSCFNSAFSKNAKPSVAFPPQALPRVKKAKCPPTTGLAKKLGPGKPPSPSVLCRSEKGRSDIHSHQRVPQNDGWKVKMLMDLPVAVSLTQSATLSRISLLTFSLVTAAAKNSQSVFVNRWRLSSGKPYFCRTL